MKNWRMVCLFLLLVLNACTLDSLSAKPCGQDPSCVRILFIGNSYTFTNDLPGTLVKLAEAGGHRVETGMAATGGWALSDHIKSADSLAQISASKWNYVVLQEQSMIPASISARQTQMFPATRELADKIRTTGAKTILFITWAHKDGWPENKMPDYESMQVAINSGYITLGQQLQARLAPVGYAWLYLHQKNPQLNLWQDDGSHPNESGTYLAACVFYTVLFQQSPEGLTYQGNLTTESANLLQKMAAETVLKYEKSWNLP